MDQTAVAGTRDGDTGECGSEHRRLCTGAEARATFSLVPNLPSADCLNQAEPKVQSRAVNFTSRTDRLGDAARSEQGLVLLQTTRRANADTCNATIN